MTDVVVNHQEGFQYGGEFVWPGQVISLKRLPGDSKLMEIRYFIRFEDDNPDYEVCDSPQGRKFVNQGYLDTHLRRVGQALERYNDGRGEVDLESDADILERQLAMAGAAELKLIKGEHIAPGVIQKKNCPLCHGNFHPAEFRDHVAACQTAKGAQDGQKSTTPRPRRAPAATKTATKAAPRTRKPPTKAT